MPTHQQHNNDNPTHSFATEIQLFFALVLPTVLTNLCRTAMGLTDVSLLGHLHPNMTGNATTTHNATAMVPSTQYLAAAGYTVTWMTMANTAVVQGFAAAATVLGANAYGAGNMRLLGYYLQIAITTSTIGGLVVAGATWFAGDIMQALIGFDTHMHGLVTGFSRVLLIGYFPLVWTTCLNAWLIAQKQTLPQLITYLTCVGINVVLNVVFIYGLKDYGMFNFAGFGFLGSALATSVSRWLQFIVMSIIVYRQILGRNRAPDADATTDERGRSPSQQWDVGFIPLPTSLELQDDKNTFDWSLRRAHSTRRVSTYMKQACPMALTGVLEDGQIQFIGILAGRLGTIAAATHNGIFQVFWFLSSLMWAVSAATRVRISAYLGSGDQEGAVFGMRVATAVALPCAAGVAAALVVLRHEVGHVFSHDSRVLELVSQIMLLCGCGYFCLGAFYIFMATLAAQGRPHLIAVSFVVGAWLVCIPLAFYFRQSDFHFVLTGSVVDMNGLFGLWTAMSAGYGVTSLLAGIFVCRTDWAQVTKESVARAEMEMDGEWGEEDGGAEDLNSEGGGGINRSRTPTYQSSRRRKRGGYGVWREGDGEMGDVFDTGKARGNRHDSLLQPLI